MKKIKKFRVSGHDVKFIEDIKVKEKGKREWYSFLIDEIDGVLYYGMVNVNGKIIFFDTQEEYECVKQDVISSLKNPEVHTFTKDDKCMISENGCD